MALNVAFDRVDAFNRVDIYDSVHKTVSTISEIKLFRSHRPRSAFLERN